MLPSRFASRHNRGVAGIGRSGYEGPVGATGALARASLLAGLVGLAALVAAPGASAAPGVTTYERPGAVSKREVLDYWSARRIRKAEPLVGVVTPGAGGRGRLALASSSGSRSGSDSTKSRANFTAGEVADYATFPNTTSGKVYARMRSIGPYECSATVVNTPGMDVVFTAGHCVAEAPGLRAKKFVFIPSFHDGERPFGTWVYDRLVVPDNWARRGNFNFDFAAVVLSPLGGVPVEQAVGGGRAIAFNQPRDQLYTAFGYPFNRARGQRMRYCTSQYLRDDPHPTGSGELPFGIGCDMGAGASGGGWIVEPGVLNSVSSFGYDSRADILYGPYFGNTAQRIYNTAAGA